MAAAAFSEGLAVGHALIAPRFLPAAALSSVAARSAAAAASVNDKGMADASIAVVATFAPFVIA